ncbi:MAG: ACT domain-containing protein [Aquificaceae bacterium]
MLSFFGEDRPGIVAKVTKELYKLGLNLEDSSMTRLGNQFGILLMLSGNSSRDIIERALEEPVKELGLSFLCREISKEIKNAEYQKSYRIILHGEDKTGIVYKVSELIASLGLNISDLRTMRRSEIYLMTMEVQGDIDQTELREKLKALSGELELSFELEEEEEIGI